MKKGVFSTKMTNPRSWTGTLHELTVMKFNNNYNERHIYKLNDLVFGK